MKLSVLQMKTRGADTAICHKVSLPTFNAVFDELQKLAPDFDGLLVRRLTLELTLPAERIVASELAVPFELPAEVNS